MLHYSLHQRSKVLQKNFDLCIKKYILLHTKIKEGNNIDIHLEKLSQFPSEEEILFLPFWSYNFKKVEYKIYSIIKGGNK